MAFALTSDVETELGRPATSASETAQWQSWLDRVERKIQARFRRVGLDLDQQVALGDPTAEDVADVEVAAVIRKIQNPTWGETSTTRSIDDGSITRRREGQGADVDPLEIRPEEWASLLPDTQAAAFSTRPGFKPDRGPLDCMDWS